MLLRICCCCSFSVSESLYIFRNCSNLYDCKYRGVSKHLTLQYVTYCCIHQYGITSRIRFLKEGEQQLRLLYLVEKLRRIRLQSVESYLSFFVSFIALTQPGLRSELLMLLLLFLIPSVAKDGLPERRSSCC